MEDTFPFLMKIGILIFLHINNLKIFNIFIFKTQEKFKWNNNIHKKLLDWKWIHPKLFSFLLKKIEKLSLVEQYQNQEQMYHSLLLEPDCKFASIGKSKPNRRRKEENCSLSLEY